MAAHEFQRSQPQPATRVAQSLPEVRHGLNMSRDGPAMGNPSRAVDVADQDLVVMKVKVLMEQAHPENIVQLMIDNDAAEVADGALVARQQRLRRTKQIESIEDIRIV